MVVQHVLAGPTGSVVSGAGTVAAVATGAAGATGTGSDATVFSTAAAAGVPEFAAVDPRVP